MSELVNSCRAAFRYLSLILLLFFICCPAEAQESMTRKATLDECIREALENNHRRPASQYAVQMAEAQHKQALGSYWPQITIQGSYQKLDEPVNFIFPSQTMSFPGLTVVTPEQNIKVLSDQHYTASANATLMLYDGGMRKGITDQAQNQIEAMKIESHRTDLEIVDSVQRYYWGAVLSEKLYKTSVDTLDRMEATLNLTETLYKEGSGRVKKTDYLNNKIMVESIRAMVALLEKNRLSAVAALANTMGLSWDQNVMPVDNDLPYQSMNLDLDSLVSASYQFNPDWTSLLIAIRAADAALKTAKSGHYPKLAVTGKVYKWWPNSDNGLATEQNKEGWQVGVGVEIPLFNGMTTTNRVLEARARLGKINEEKLLLKEGLGLLIRDLFLSLAASEKSHDATLDAMNTSIENRDLNTRAYQNDLVETDDVIQAQLVEALMTARHYKARYDHIALTSKLQLAVGSELFGKDN
jgi:outer membrane protein